MLGKKKSRQSHIVFHLAVITMTPSMKKGILWAKIAEVLGLWVEEVDPSYDACWEEPAPLSSGTSALNGNPPFQDCKGSILLPVLRPSSRGLLVRA